MNAGIQKTPGVLLFKPFVFIAGGNALLLGLAVILLSSLVGAASNTHFDGVLDTHTGSPAPLWFFLSEGLLDWFWLALVLLIAGRIISKTPFRTIDLLGTQALARWPAIFMAMVTLPAGVQRFNNSLLEVVKSGKWPGLDRSDGLLFFAALGVTILALIWMVALMYQSFSISCNVRGARAIVTFTGGLLLAEILSKFALYGLALLTFAGPHPATADTGRSLGLQGLSGDWFVLSGNREQWDSASGAINGHSTSGDAILASTNRYADVSVSATVSTTNREASLVLRFQDPDNGYLAAFVPDGTPAAKAGISKISLLKRVGGVEQELAILIKRGLSGPGHSEKLSFTAKGQHLEILLNDVPVLATNDDTFASGFIGLRVYGDPKFPCDGVFSNLHVQ